MPRECGSLQHRAGLAAARSELRPGQGAERPTASVPPPKRSGVSEHAPTSARRAASIPLDIVVTWPKDRAFGSYMVELERAKARGLQINFRVPKLPLLPNGRPPHRCYRVHDGYVRGWLQIVACQHRGLGEVERVESDPLRHVPGARHWPPGNYIVCDPEWHEAPRPLVAMPGFRGWRWFDRTTVGD